MNNIQILSIEPPFDSSQIAREAVAAFATAAAMGLFPEKGSPRQLTINGASFASLLDCLSAAGIATAESVESRSLRSWEPSRLGDCLRKIQHQLEECPVPQTEWPALQGILGAEMLVCLVNISPASLHRYGSGERPTPDPAAARLHALALIVGDLQGSYNEFGIRRWFQRRRDLLDGKSPGELLRGDWKPEDPGPSRVRDLARSLAAAPAT